MPTRGLMVSSLLQAIAHSTFAANSETETIGTHRLQTVVGHLLNDFMFDIPDAIGPDSQVVVTRELVQEKLSGLVKNRDLSQFIL